MSFAEELLNFRSYFDLTQEQAAEILGTAQNHICNYEHGRRNPTRKNLIKFRRIMNDYKKSKEN